MDMESKIPSRPVEGRGSEGACQSVRGRLGPVKKARGKKSGRAKQNDPKNTTLAACSVEGWPVPTQLGGGPCENPLLRWQVMPKPSSGSIQFVWVGVENAALHGPLAAPIAAPDRLHAPGHHQAGVEHDLDRRAWAAHDRHYPGARARTHAHTEYSFIAGRSTFQRCVGGAHAAHTRPHIDGVPRALLGSGACQ